MRHERAFPQHTLEPNPNGGEPRIIWQEGMDLRDYFAAKAMQALTPEYSVHNWENIVARKAYEVADAMMEARK